MTDTDIDVASIPDMTLMKHKFLLAQSSEAVSSERHSLAKAALMQIIKEGDMAPYYSLVCQELEWAPDVQLVASMTLANKQKLAELDDVITDAQENHGDPEIRRALLKRALYLTSIGDKEAALTAFRVAATKTVSLSQRLDISLALARIGFFFQDTELLQHSIEKAVFQLEEGGDWDRKNRLKIYEALFLILKRDFAGAAVLFIDSLATFTAYELCTFHDIVKYAVLTGLVSVDRVTIKTKLIDSPEVLGVIKELPYIGDLVSSLYYCNYAAFFNSLAAITEELKRDHWFSKHNAYFCREMRIRAYKQLLQSYKSVQLESMAQQFGVTVEFLDKELSRFIFSGRLNAQIDKVTGLVHTSRAEEKSALYGETLRAGDALLNRIQKLSRVIAM